MNLTVEAIRAAEAKRVPNVPGFGHQLIGAWGFPKREPSTPEEWAAAVEAARQFIAHRLP